MLGLARDLALYWAFMVAATSVLSLPLSPATLLAVKVAAPWLVALVAAGASALSAVFDHALVRRLVTVRTLSALRGRRGFRGLEGWARRRWLVRELERFGRERHLVRRLDARVRSAPFWTTFLCAALPVPFAIARWTVPVVGYPVARYVVAVALGRFFRILPIAYFGTVVEIPVPILLGLLAGGVLLAGVGAGLERRQRLRRSRHAPAGGEGGGEGETPD